MDKLVKIMLIIWAVLALVCFAGAFTIPSILLKVLNLAFGGMNILLIIGWIVSAISEKKQKLE